MKRFSQAGVALVEFALVVPVMMLILIGLIEVGRFAYLAILVGNAAHAGAEYGAQTIVTVTDTTGMRNAALQDGQSISGLNASGTQVCKCWNGATASALSCSASVTSCPAGSHRVIYAQVSATGTFHPLFNYGPLGFPDPWTVTRVAQIRVSQDQ